jgi:hypothetical protein
MHQIFHVGLLFCANVCATPDPSCLWRMAGNIDLVALGQSHTTVSAATVQLSHQETASSTITSLFAGTAYTIHSIAD